MLTSRPLPGINVAHQSFSTNLLDFPRKTSYAAQTLGHGASLITSVQEAFGSSRLHVSEEHHESKSRPCRWSLTSSCIVLFAELFNSGETIRPNCVDRHSSNPESF